MVLLESLTACEEDGKPGLEMYFTVHLAFVDYLDQLNETKDTPVIKKLDELKANTTHFFRICF